MLKKNKSVESNGGAGSGRWGAQRASVRDGLPHITGPAVARVAGRTGQQARDAEQARASATGPHGGQDCAPLIMSLPSSVRCVFLHKKGDHFRDIQPLLCDAPRKDSDEIHVKLLP
jgi:hypothetical protein